MSVVTADDLATSTAAPDTPSHLYLLCFGPDSHTAWPEKHFNCYQLVREKHSALVCFFYQLHFGNWGCGGV